MALFLVNGRVRVQQYMSETDQITDEMMLVEADDAASAEELFEAYWRAHSVDYSVYYYGYANHCSPVLTKQMVVDKVASRRK
jgi:hypothetical protein